MSLHRENTACLDKVTSQQATSGKQLKVITIKYQIKTDYGQLVTEKKSLYEQRCKLVVLENLKSLPSYTVDYC